MRSNNVISIKHLQATTTKRAESREFIRINTEVVK